METGDNNRSNSPIRKFSKKDNPPTQSNRKANDPVVPDELPIDDIMKEIDQMHLLLDTITTDGTGVHPKGRGSPAMVTPPKPSNSLSTDPKDKDIIQINNDTPYSQKEKQTGRVYFDNDILSKNFHNASSYLFMKNPKFKNYTTYSTLNFNIPPGVSNKLGFLKGQISFFLKIMKVANPSFSILIYN